MEKKFVHTSLDSPIAEVAVLLVGLHNGEYFSCGTSCIIGPGIAITAKHVIDGFFECCGNERITDRKSGENIEAPFSLEAFQVWRRENRIVRWSVKKIYAQGPTDLVFLKLEPKNEDQIKYKWPKINLQLGPPEVGEYVAAFGYHSTKIENPAPDYIKININPYTSTGRVVEIHHVKRDNSRLHFPCFRTDARYDCGMSGGPVFNSRGALCGIICSNLPPVSCDPEGEHISYVTTLWPAMAIRVNINRGDRIREKKYPILELFKKNHLSAVDAENVNLILDENGLAIAAIYKNG